jgi:leucyl-tRNA synthetase
MRSLLLACSAVALQAGRLTLGAVVAPHSLSIARSSRVFARSRALASDAGVKYEPRSVETKWQAYWEQHETFKTVRRAGKPKKYVLDMFPYPSAAGLHVGHPEGYTASDIMARYWRMCGYDVLHPMGWDSFGLPAEQHAVATGTHPRDTTASNIANFKRQLKSLGFSYDWARELATTDLDYVKWTQWIFLQLFHKGLAQQSEVPVNWCAGLGTVLANEEVINGLSERGNFPVERLPLRQWVLKITEYADKLADGLEGLEWPEGTRTAQRQWIGRSEGAAISFDVLGAAHAGLRLDVFTTRADTLLGATYVVVAPEHPLLAQLATAEHRAGVEAYVAAAKGKSELDRTAAGPDKTGAPTGATVAHPLTGAPLPVWVSDYVIGTYGTGAVMAVPAHDERDFAFARKFALPIKRVVAQPDAPAEDGELEAPMCDDGVVVNSGAPFDGLSSAAARTAVTTALAAKGMGAARVNYKLRDWVFSRQRYWGEPIPIYFPVELAAGSTDPRTQPHRICYETAIAVDESELPIALPELEDFSPGDNPEGCLARATEWRYFQRDGKWFARETNTMPQWAGSCWYYLRFMDPANSAAGWSAQAAADWLPVDLYVGGAEHAVLHLLYARFWHKALFDAGLVPTPEPFQQLVHQGMILGTDGEKMSKSRGNVVNPDEIVDVYGADAMRLYEMFMGPLEAVKPWQTAQISGVVRFRDKVAGIVARAAPSAPLSDETLRLQHLTIKKVTQMVDTLGARARSGRPRTRAGRAQRGAARACPSHLPRLPHPHPPALLPADHAAPAGFNTAISAMMVFANHLAALDTAIPVEPVEVRARQL